MLQKNSIFSLFNSQEELDRNAAQFIIEKAKIAINEKGSFSLVLSGGTTPVNVYKLLAKEQVNFEKWYIYFGDERCFPLNHLERNSNVAELIWLSKVNIPKSNIFIIPAELGNKDGSLAYEKILDKNKSFDLVILGLGDDGHIASLFPNHQWENTKQVISVSNSPKAPSDRISLTLSRLSNTEEVLFLISGKNKAHAFNRWKEGGDLPANLISAKNQISIMAFDIF
ncbi:6-phosphogluconolactonase [Methylophilaceae bacterium]|jgi:6-phosphogluconolactonase|nr:6-phosphogluconolactonase [Methylophilaceae bacterium]|tara:strand:+ start:1095 stop:1772 length:678 start_codon:yes stop_codon:yes gene_type:complete